MAKEFSKKVLSIDSEWKRGTEKYEGKDEPFYEAMATVQGDKGSNHLVIRVTTEEVGKRVKPGETYVGPMFRPKNPDGSDGTWRLKLFAKANPSLSAGGGQAPSGHGGASTASGPGGHRGGGEDGRNVGMRVGMCINQACALAIAEMQQPTVDGSVCSRVNKEHVVEYARFLFALAVELEGGSGAGQASAPGTMNQAMVEALMKEINAAIDSAGLTERFGASTVTDYQAIECWQQAGANPTKFAIAFNALLGKPDEGGAMPGEEHAGNDLPF